ncbi:LysR family transcriptional regulator [Amycolatopsis rhizosphaerae]|uniref:LysR family transcriptional regulator n=1 Tax=Amycolatopsis rhizosphaerae TaxID=2053003 RepID=A0A558BEE0_9PSEU|nr:LysR family transcriptional regulator [Amycolatopsis rhizosphaerae]TVT34873.1 LysR family transcriptional regulator [Amycolatopsis rhizosphaerae]
MELKQLVALVTVGDTGSVTKAARLLHVVQPAVSRYIRALEDEVGVPLFERSRQGMTLTPAGEVLAGRARRALLELERARAEIRPDRHHIQGIVTIGLLESTVELVSAPLVEALGRRHPGIDLRLLSAFSGHLQQWLDDGAVDMSLLYNLASTPSISVTPLLREALWAVAPPEAELSGGDALTWARVSENRLVLPVVGHGLRTLIDQALRTAGVEPTIACQTNSMLVQKKLVAVGTGWSVLPAAGVAEDVAAGRLNGGPMADPEIFRTIVLALPRGGRVPPAVEVVAAEIVRVTRRLIENGAWPTASVVAEFD